ncbi:MAG TPA: agmatine deiminase family protein [Bacteroidales bacterium]|nr:agmatine deiminase family protein [Bacteroidales bacterium]
MPMVTPDSLGYFFPAEWARHEATWLTFPCHEDSFPGKMDDILPSYMAFLKIISQGEKVRINVQDKQTEQKVIDLIHEYGIDPGQAELFIHPSDDVWCRDHGPSFLINPERPDNNKVVVNWEFNAWGSKYPYERDNAISGLIAEKLGLKAFSPGIVLEGGSVELNGKGTLITTETCMLHPNRNPHLNRGMIEKHLTDYFGVDQVLWLSEGIAGDDTDGHVDNLTRFVNEDTVITMIEPDTGDLNHLPLRENLQRLKTFRLLNGKPLQIVEVPMPSPVYHEGKRLPASYANFYICNHAVIIPTFRCENDRAALDLFEKLFKDRKVTGIDSTDIVWGIGSFHCLTQQEPWV